MDFRPLSELYTNLESVDFSAPDIVVHSSSKYVHSVLHNCSCMEETTGGNLETVAEWCQHDGLMQERRTVESLI